MRQLSLLLLVILPGLTVTSVSLYYLFPEWIALEVSHQNFQRVAENPASTLTEVYIAQAAENRHRINCFAEGVGVLFGLSILAMGVHGICLIPKEKKNPHL
ncbi:hypothetical protein M595_3185 [Lyngbya aestuarii BL J]|uniref:Uncharacterized protein n=1 Tax=Lyngbya aestuarii BL J TaxID=1348334 RepID=U7QG35_9CYAN|nr:hypothetical protein [Lyngbya aestuarii]ERT06904.1 hypothetical protein M595_3185 [Lyngbya aestuarii BL J]